MPDDKGLFLSRSIRSRTTLDAYLLKKDRQFGMLLFTQLIVLIGLAGCGGPSNTGCVVSGRVTLNGEPLPHGLIRFMPKQQSAGLQTVSASAEISEGAFSVPASSKLSKGSYQVAITAEKKTGRKISAEEGSTELADEFRQYLPLKYNSRTTLSAEITGDTDDLEFALELRRKR